MSMLLQSIDARAANTMWLYAGVCTQDSARKSDSIDQLQEAKGVSPLGARSQQISQGCLDEGVCPLVNACSCLIKRYDDSILQDCPATLALLGSCQVPSCLGTSPRARPAETGRTETLEKIQSYDTLLHTHPPPPPFPLGHSLDLHVGYVITLPSTQAVSDPDSYSCLHRLMDHPGHQDSGLPCPDALPPEHSKVWNHPPCHWDPS